MPIVHNRLVRFWGNPTEQKFDYYLASSGLLNDNDAQNLIKFGAYMIKKGLRDINKIQPYDRREGLMNWVHQYEGNALLYIGTEFLIKGIFLKKGYAINAYKDKNKNRDYVTSPIKLNRNKGKLSASKTRDLGYFIEHIDVIADFSSFDADQQRRNGKTPPPNLDGLLSTRYRNPNHTQIFQYIRFTRNSYLHTSKHMPTFNGIYKDMAKLFDVLCRESLGKSLYQLSKLRDPIV